MRTELTISSDAIDECGLRRKRAMSSGMGAAVYFAGAVRGTEGGKAIRGIEYEAFEKMAEHQFELIFTQAGKRWPVESIRLAHRVGRVGVGEVSIWVEVVAPHRDEAFAACQFIISEMKRVVPIWKKPLV
ncbi:MAG TPA: molybdenum cofactor biosynthesis protein MoaE [Verrucomicrobiae bacterium]|jgi:molybdopterin synthase catalytic subunit|nr:molybdenum cofactor biosynthesis protein MoaE [Verrucomicrobiae bacterium]